MSYLELQPREVEIPRTVAEALVLVVANPAQLTRGDVLIKRDTPLPSSLRGISLRRIGLWNLLFGLKASECDRLTRSGGWHFFFFAQALESTAVAATASGAIQKAFNRMSQQAEREGINAIEIIEVHTRKLFGMCRTRIAAHRRHIKSSPYFRDPDPNHRVKGLWDFMKMFEVIERIEARHKQSQSKLFPKCIA